MILSNIVKTLCAVLFILKGTSSNSIYDFQGGTMWWKVSSVGTQRLADVTTLNVDITMRLFWATPINNNIAYPCASNDDVATGNTISADSELLTSLNDPTSWSLSTDTSCFSYSGGDLWMSGLITKTVAVTTTQTVTAAYTSCCWANSAATQGDTASWNMPLTINLAPRADTNKINSSPYASIYTGLIKVSTACPSTLTIRIPVTDLDGDTVRCRCTADTCLDIVSLNSVTCAATITPNGYTGYFVIDLLVEDFAPLISNTQALSSVPLSILVKVSTDSNDCPFGSSYTAPISTVPQTILY